MARSHEHALHHPGVRDARPARPRPAADAGPDNGVLITSWPAGWC
ncbi:hypothetical protein NKH18_24745 [Streptomyces sp. M10(2022)]